MHKLNLACGFMQKFISFFSYKCLWEKKSKKTVTAGHASDSMMKIALRFPEYALLKSN